MDAQRAMIESKTGPTEVPKKKAKPPITTRVDDWELADVKKVAEIEEMSISKLTRTVLMDYVNKKLAERENNEH